MEVFRITHKKWASALVASKRSARWNSNKVEVIYAASSRSLACLENIVHTKNIGNTNIFCTMVIYIPDNIKIQVLSLTDLPDGWHLTNEKSIKSCSAIGDSWVADSESAVLIVPSAIIHNEKNVLINPNHPDFSQIKLVNTEPFFFDPRINQ